MPGIVRLNKQGLADLIDNIKNNGGDASDLDNLMSEIIEDERLRRPVKRREASLRIRVEEPTTEERLEAAVGELFPGGITGPILEKCIEMDGKYALEELRDMCREAGLSPSGAKKELAAKLIAKGIV
ncbi:hypothetical protein ES703_38120 [subsurface metagenome]